MTVSDEIEWTLQIDGVLSPYVEARDEGEGPGWESWTLVVEVSAL